MVNVLPVASGKGGVGKSALSTNLSVALAQNGNKVVLIDFDLGGSNLHTLLGLKNNHAGLGNFIYRQTDNLASLLQDSGIDGLQFIAGDCLFPGTANMDFFIKRKLMKEISALDADYVLLDLGAGSAYNTLDFYLMTYNSLLITTAELTAVLNAYSFLKAAAYRFLIGQFKAKSQERAFIKKYICNSAAGAENSFTELTERLEENFPDSTTSVKSELKKYRPQIILNQGRSAQDLDMCRRLRSLVKNKLSLDMDFVGCIAYEPEVSMAIARRKPLILTRPDSTFARQVRETAERISQHDYMFNETLEFDDIGMFENSFIQAGEN